MDLLAQIRVANAAHQDQLAMPFSRAKAKVADALMAGGLISSWTAEESAGGKMMILEIEDASPFVFQPKIEAPFRPSVERSMSRDEIKDARRWGQRLAERAATLPHDR